MLVWFYRLLLSAAICIPKHVPKDLQLLGDYESIESSGM